MLYIDCMYEELKELREATSQLMENLAPNRLTQEMLERVRVALQKAQSKLTGDASGELNHGVSREQA
jgi:hypothetical protein